VSSDLLFEQVMLHEWPVTFAFTANPSPLIYSENNQFGVSPRREFKIGQGIWFEKAGHHFHLLRADYCRSLQGGADGQGKRPDHRHALHRLWMEN
jgi:hypothetical protein